MAEPNLSGEIDVLNRRYADELSRLRKEVEALETEVDRISGAIRGLETHRQSTSQRIYQAQKVLQGLNQDKQDETLDLVIAAMDSCRGWLSDVSNTSYDLRADLEAQRSALLQEDPTLAASLHEYQEFEGKLQSILSDLPAEYQKVFKQAHNRLKEKLAEVLGIEEKIRELRIPEAIQLPIIQALNLAEGQVYWVLPAPATPINASARLQGHMDAMEGAFITCISSLATQIDLLLPDLERTEWAGFRSITTLYDPGDHSDLAAVVQEHLSEKLAEYWAFPDLSFPVKISPWVVSLDWPVWLAGKERTYSPEAEILEQVERLGFDVENPLFGSKDIVSWERPLRVSVDSLWTVDARRLRSLLMRLVVQGRVGRLGLCAEDMVRNLPALHRAAILADISALLEHGVLSVEANGVQDNFHVNPTRLADAQDLINRDITAFWIPIVATSSGSVPAGAI